MGEFLTWYQIEALFARRDAIVTLLEKRGVDAVFDRRVQ
jgi:hypothetical protein